MLMMPSLIVMSNISYSKKFLWATMSVWRVFRRSWVHIPGGSHLFLWIYSQQKHHYTTHISSWSNWDSVSRDQFWPDQLPPAGQLSWDHLATRSAQCYKKQQHEMHVPNVQFSTLWCLENHYKAVVSLRHGGHQLWCGGWFCSVHVT